MDEKPRPHGRRQPLREGSTIYAQRRVALGLSLRDVEHRTGINRGFLSRVERGRMIPTADESAVLLNFYAQVQSQMSGDLPAG
jgi:predicted transcriptional regulator